MDPLRQSPVIDLQSSEMRVNPFPTYTWLREEKPVCRVEPGGLWALSRFDDVQFALKNYAIFSSANKAQLLSPSWLRKECHRDLFVIAKDPPEQTPYRAAIIRPFLSSAIAGLVPLMQRTAASCADRMFARGEADFIEDFAYPYIGKIIGHITGLEGTQSLSEIRGWVEVVQQLSYRPPDEADLKRMEEVIIRQHAYFDEVIKEKRRAPTDDVISQLVHTQVEGKPLSDGMLSNAMDLLLRGGFLTTVHLLGNGMVQLERRPELRRSLIQSPELIPAFVDELLRLYSSGAASVRFTTQDVELHGVTIPKNEAVILLQAAANRDPRHFSNPDDFDLTRPLKKHMAFGYGPHACVGLALARLETEIAFENLLPHLETFSCPPEEQLKWINSSLVRGLEELPISFRRKL